MATAPPARSVVRTAEIRPVGRAEGARLAREEYSRVAAVLRGIGTADWVRTTDCDPWTVRDLVAHLAATVRALCNPARLAADYGSALARMRRRGGTALDHYNAVGIEARGARSTESLVAEFGRWAPRAASVRRLVPPPVRWVRLRLFGDWLPVALMLDTLLTRDVWIHRVDLTRALGQNMVLTAEHDGRIVADMVLDWGRRHGRSFVLTLDGPAGGIYRQGAGGDDLHLDAVEFCRILSGRARGDGLLRTPVPF